MIICIVGMSGSGKSVVADRLVERGFNFFRFGQITLDEIKERGLELNEINERIIREGNRKKYGMGAYAILNIPKIEELKNKGNVVGDGLYSWEEYLILKEKYGSEVVILSVWAPPRIRYERLSKREYNPEMDKKMRNRPTDVETSKERDKSEIENLNKGGPIAMADYTIINEGTVEELRNKVDEFLRKFS